MNTHNVTTTKPTHPTTHHADASPLVPTLVDPAPAAGAPTPPVTPHKIAPGGMYLRPSKGQEVDAPSAAEELGTSPTFTRDFGGLGLSQSDLSQNLSRAAAWRAERQKGKDWALYVSAKDAVAWDLTLRQLEVFKQAFAYAVACDPTVAKRYPHTAQLLKARSLVAKRAAVAAAKKEKKAQKAATAAPPPTAAAPGAPAAK